MKLVPCLVALFCAYIPCAKAATYQLVWWDDFNGPSIDQTAWNFEIGKIRNNEEQYYTSRWENARIEAGNLVIECRRENYAGSAYTSASLNTQGKKSFTYGRIEMRAKLPYGKGLWPAFWTLGANIGTVGWPACGEIDIMEMIGGGTGFDDTIYGGLHWFNGGAQNALSWATITNDIYANYYHVFAVEWTPTTVKYYMDGWNYSTRDISNTAVYSEFHAPHFLLLNLAIGGNWPNSVGKKPDAGTPLPQRYSIDYVRVYQLQ